MKMNTEVVNNVWRLKAVMCSRTVNFIHTACVKLFWERDHKGGYLRDRPKHGTTELIRDGLKELKGEIMLWKDEVKEHLEGDPILAYRRGEIDIVWQFSQPGALSQWVTTSDSDHSEGHSTCELSLSRGGRGLFMGTLCTQVPKDGRIKRAGYSNMRSLRPRVCRPEFGLWRLEFALYLPTKGFNVWMLQKSFKRDSYFDWRMYSHIVLRVRGDGRSYMLNIATMGYYDIMWNDVYSYALFTRGGPYWQLSKIPFSKFFLTSKGRIQDKQNPIPLDKVTHVGISAADKVNGSFHLEIDYIGLEFDPAHNEEFAYEMYTMPKYTVGV